MMLGFRSKERALRKDRDRYVGFAFAAAETLIELDRDRTVRTVAGANPLGDGAKLLERCFTDLLAPGERAVMAAALACTAAGGRLPQTVVHLDHPTHGARPHVVSGWCLPDLDRHFFLALRPQDAPVVDAGEAADSETGLLVPTAFKDSVAAFAAGSGDGAMTLLDLEGLTEVRGRLGGSAASSLMEKIGATLSGASVGGGMASRTSEESFGLVHAAHVDIRALVRSLREMVLHADPSGEGVKVREASVPLAAPGISKDQAADAVLYAMRRFGASRGGSVELGTLSECCSTMISESVDRLSRLNGVIADGSFNIDTQVVVDLKSREPLHHVLLCRFDDPELVDFAEGLGRRDELDLAIVGRALKALEKLFSQARKTISLSAPLSMASLAKPAFQANLEAMLRGRINLRSRLMFDLVGVPDPADLIGVNQAIQALRRAGHGIVLDQFGVGAGALDVLRAVEVDAVRVGGDQVGRGLTDVRSRAYLKAMTGFCLEMGVTVIGTGIDSDRLAQFLGACGVRCGQGDVFGKPRPLSELFGGSRPSRGTVILPTRTNALS